MPLLLGRYHLVAADFSDVKSLRAKLEESEVDYSCPTLVLAECALVYANADKVSSVRNCQRKICGSGPVLTGSGT